MMLAYDTGRLSVSVCQCARMYVSLRLCVCVSEWLLDSLFVYLSGCPSSPTCLHVSVWSVCRTVSI